MPTYDYQCTSCDTVHEVFHGFREAGPDTCPACGAQGTLRKLISAGSGIIFKGTGFYETDYKRSNGNEKKSPAPPKTSEKPAAEKPASETSSSSPADKADTAKTPSPSKAGSERSD
jgi:putative FmdB family regulatory protein